MASYRVRIGFHAAFLLLWRISQTILLMFNAASTPLLISRAMTPLALHPDPPPAFQSRGRTPASAGSLRTLAQQTRRLGIPALVLDAAHPGLRPRELDRSARREIAAILRQNELSLAGLDLNIPPAHFINPAHADRAASAVLEALDLLADLASLARSAVAAAHSQPSDRARIVNMRLPDNTPSDLRSAIAHHAIARSCRIANFDHPPVHQLVAAQLPAAPSDSPIGLGLHLHDLTHASSNSSADPLLILARLAPALRSLRLPPAVLANLSMPPAAATSSPTRLALTDLNIPAVSSDLLQATLASISFHGAIILDPPPTP